MKHKFDNMFSCRQRPTNSPLGHIRRRLSKTIFMQDMRESSLNINRKWNFQILFYYIQRRIHSSIIFLAYILQESTHVHLAITNYFKNNRFKIHILNLTGRLYITIPILTFPTLGLGICRGEPDTTKLKIEVLYGDTKAISKTKRGYFRHEF